MKKKLDVGNITNELKGASLFFTKSTPTPPVPEPVIEKTANPLADSPFFEKTLALLPQAQIEKNQDRKRSDERTVERTPEGSPERTFRQKREKIRHTFDVYKDQLISLQVIQLERVQAGKKKPKLGKMVSDGIDLYLKQAASKIKRA